MIQIENLTPRQRQLMDLLWACRDTEQVDTLIAALPTLQDQYDAAALVRIAVWESIESESGLDRYEADAKTVIDRCSRK